MGRTAEYFNTALVALCKLHSVLFYSKLTHEDGPPGRGLLALTWEVAHFLSMSLVAPGGGVILLNSPVLSRGVGTSRVFLLFEGKDNQLHSKCMFSPGRRGISTKEPEHTWATGGLLVTVQCPSPVSPSISNGSRCSCCPHCCCGVSLKFKHHLTAWEVRLTLLCLQEASLNLTGQILLSLEHQSRSSTPLFLSAQRPHDLP